MLAAADPTSCANCGVPITTSVPGRSTDLLCAHCGTHWLTYKEYRPLTLRQQGVARAKADERSSNTVATLIDRLFDTTPPTPGSASALRLASFDAMMQCVVGLPVDDERVLSLPLPPLLPFAYTPVFSSVATMCMRSNLFGPDTQSLIAGLPLASFSMLTSVQV